MKNIQQAIEIVGGASKLARAVGVSQQAVHLWKSGKTQMLACHAAAVQDATDGRVTAYAIGKEGGHLRELAA